MKSGSNSNCRRCTRVSSAPRCSTSTPRTSSSGSERASSATFQPVTVFPLFGLEMILRYSVPTISSMSPRRVTAISKPRTRRRGRPPPTTRLQNPSPPSHKVGAPRSVTSSRAATFGQCRLSVYCRQLCPLSEAGGGGGGGSGPVRTLALELLSRRQCRYGAGYPGGAFQFFGRVENVRRELRVLLRLSRIGTDLLRRSAGQTLIGGWRKPGNRSKTAR